MVYDYDFPVLPDNERWYIANRLGGRYLERQRKRRLFGWKVVSRAYIIQTISPGTALHRAVNRQQTPQQERDEARALMRRGARHREDVKRHFPRGPVR